MKYSILSALVIVLFAMKADGQETVTAPYVWRKLVSREIMFGGGNAAENKTGKQVATGATPGQLMADAMNKGMAKAYTNTDLTLNTALRKDEMDDLNRAPGTEDKKKQAYNYAAIKRYRILEEWTFDPITCNTNVQIKGIAPVREVYTKEGTLRGVQAMFWLRYKDAKRVLDAYDRDHKQHTIQGMIWADNFSKKSSVNGYGVCVATVELNMAAASDTGRHRYKEQAPCNEMAEMLVDAKLDGATGWSDLEFNHTLNASEVVDESAMKVDTIVIVDPVTGQEERKVARFLRSEKNKVRVAEQWTYDADNGKTEIKPVGVAVLAEGKEAPAFWVKYGDVQALIANNDAACPDHSFALTLWKSFTAEVKPVVVK